MSALEKNETNDVTVANPVRTTNILLVIIVFLLLGNIVIPFMQSGYKEEIETQMAVISIMAENAQDIIDTYQDVAYGPRVDRIAEQQLLASETTNDLIGQLIQQIEAAAQLALSIQGLTAEE